MLNSNHNKNLKEEKLAVLYRDLCVELKSVIVRIHSAQNTNKFHKWCLGWWSGGGVLQAGLALLRGVQRQGAGRADSGLRRSQARQSLEIRSRVQGKEMKDINSMFNTSEGCEINKSSDGSYTHTL